MIGAALICALLLQSRAPLVIASKPFGESYILAEMFAQVLERAHIPVTRKPGLGATEIAFASLRTGAVDVFPEYTGTGLVAILHDSARTDREAFRKVEQTFRTRYGLQWLPPLGFQNTYAIAVRRQTADSLHLRTLSDLAAASPRLVGGFTPDFIGRSDGLVGLSKEYGMNFRSVRTLLQAVKYRALAESAVDVIDGYSTDGMIARYDLVVLEDDRGFFPPYEAAALLSASAAARPEVIAALSALSGKLDEATMRQLNKRVEVDNEDVAHVARNALVALGALDDSVHLSRATTRSAGWLSYAWSRRGELASLTLRHIMLVAVSLGIAIAIGIPLALVLADVAFAETIIRIIAAIQTIPGIALLAFMIPLFGIGVVPSLVALFLYSLYPIVRNTFSGLRSAAPDAVDSAEALGMTRTQVLLQVRLPLAAPAIMAGVRTAAVLDVGTATLAAFIGAGGLGEPIVSGLALADTALVLSGAVPAALLALVVDGALQILERGVRPRGLSRAR